MPDDLEAEPVDRRQALRDRLADCLYRLDNHQWGGDHGFAHRYGADAETDSFVDGILTELDTAADQQLAEQGAPVVLALPSRLEPAEVDSIMAAFARATTHLGRQAHIARGELADAKVALALARGERRDAENANTLLRRQLAEQQAAYPDPQLAEHRPHQIGTHDAEGFRTHAIPGDVCLGCSDPGAGRWVPISQCPRALAVLDAEDTDIGLYPRGWFAEQGDDQPAPWNWRPVLQLDGMVMPTDGPWFDTEAGCLEFIRDNVLGRGMFHTTDNPATSTNPPRAGKLTEYRVYPAPTEGLAAISIEHAPCTWYHVVQLGCLLPQLDDLAREHHRTGCTPPTPAQRTPPSGA